MSNNTTSMHISDAGRGWFRVWNGSALVAACPSRKAAQDVIDAFAAREQLTVERSKVALLEESLESQLAPRRLIDHLFRRQA